MRRKKLKNKLEKLVNIKAIPILIAIFVCLLSIGYSAFQQNLLLDNMEMEILKQSDINISDVSITSTEGNAVSLSLSKKEGKITDKINMPQEDSSITYAVTIINLGNEEAGIREITNDNTTFDTIVDDGVVGNKICDREKCTLGASKTFNVEVKYKEGMFSEKFEYDLNYDSCMTVLSSDFKDSIESENDLKSVCGDSSMASMIPYLYIQNKSMTEEEATNYLIEKGVFISNAGDNSQYFDININIDTDAVYTITYVGIDNKEKYPSEVIGGSKIDIDIGNANMPNSYDIYMGENKLVKNTDYSEANSKITINNVSDNIKILNTGLLDIFYVNMPNNGFQNNVYSKFTTNIDLGVLISDIKIYHEVAGETIDVDNSSNKTVLKISKLTGGNSYILGTYKLGSANSYKCKSAKKLKTNLYTERCFSSTCSSDSNGTITYGTLGEDGALTSGQLLFCDVDGNGYYDSDEGFYYVTSLSTDSNYAVLLFHDNTYLNSTTNKLELGNEYYNPDLGTEYIIEYGNNLTGPKSALKNLPTITDWPNVSLSNTERQILSENGLASTNAGSLGIFSYSGYAARLLTYQELSEACSSDNSLALNNCLWLFQNTRFNHPYDYSNMYLKGYWLETHVYDSGADDKAFYLSGENLSLNSDTVASENSVRPVIEILKSEIDY